MRHYAFGLNLKFKFIYGSAFITTVQNFSQFLLPLFNEQ